MKFSTILLLVSLILINQVTAQNIGINGTGANPNASALLDIDDAGTNNKGLLIPRIPLTAINAAAPVTSPATSLLVYNTVSASTGTNAVSPGYYYWDGTKWVRFSNNSSGSLGDAWITTGNAGTNPTTHFLGTTDNQDLVFRTNNTERLRINQANGFVGITENNPTRALDVTGDVLFKTTIGANFRMSNTASTAFAEFQINNRNLELGSGQFFINRFGSSLLNINAGGGDMNIGEFHFSGSKLQVTDGLPTNTEEVIARFYRKRSDAVAPSSAMTGAIIFAAESFTNESSPAVAALKFGWENNQTNDNTDRDGYLAFHTSENDGLSNFGGSERIRIASNGNVGINTTAPANKLEITQGTAGNSGLRFTNLLNAAVLKTDANGDVVTATASTATNNGVFWALNGNSGTNAATNFLGTTDMQNLAFRTNNTLYLALTTNGILINNLFSNAIGTDGQGISNNSLGFQNNQGAFTASFYNALSGNYSNGVLIKSLSTSSLTTLLDVSTGTVNAIGVPIFNVKGNGNVGIGTAAPSEKLHVFGGRQIIESSLNTGTSLKINNTDVGGTQWAIVSNGSANTGGAGKLQIINETTTVPAMFIIPTGNVGIGESNPVAKLDVVGKIFSRLQSLGNNTSIQLDPTVSETPKMSFHASDNTNRFNLVANLFTSQASDVLTFNSISTNNILNITNGGNVGLGTTSPGDKLSVGGRAEFQTTLNDHGVRIAADPTNTHSKLQFTDIPVTVEWASIQAFPSGGGQLSFITNNAPRVTILNNGYVGIATNTPSYNLQVSGVSYIDGKCIAERAGNGNPMFEAVKTDAGVGTMMSYIVNGSSVGSISTSGAAISYNTTSDIRLKENIRPISKGLNDLLKIGVKEYNYKADGTKKTETGFIAQELYEIFPQAVHKGGDDAKTNPWMIDYSKLTPLLVKGIQEQQQEIENLKQAHKSEIENLLKRIEALEKK